MPDPDPPYFAVVIDGETLDRPLEVCTNSEFHVVRDRALGPRHSAVFTDRNTVLLDAVTMAGGWLVRLHDRYYRHPFGPPSDGDAPPGVP